MENKDNIVMKMVMPIIKTVVAVVIVTIVLLLILALMLYKLKFQDNVILICIGVIYFVANLIGGLIIGKVKMERKFIWGMVVGLTYFFVLGIVSFIVTQSFFSNGVPGIIALLSCAAGGTIGGMIS